jgi:hypothetical protein
MASNPFFTSCRWCVFLFLITLASGCGMFKGIGRNVVDGASEKTDALVQNAVKGLGNGLDDPKTKKQIAHFADSIITALNNSLTPKVKRLIDTAINHRIILWADSLVEALTGDKLQLNVKNLQTSLVGKSKEDILEIRNAFQTLIEEILSDKTNSKLGKLRDNLLGAKTDSAISKLRDNLLGAKTDSAVGKLRDELLGAKTDSAISKIVDHAAQKFVDRVNPALQNDVSFVSKHATALLLTLGGIAAAIIALIWYNKRRYERMVALLTKQIHNIPDQQVYDHVTSKIKDEAITAGLEPGLRKILQANGLTGDTDWKSKLNK